MVVKKRLTTDCGIEVVETGGSLWPEIGAGLEWVNLRLSGVYRGAGLPRGNGQPVITVPGFLGSDAAMFELRCWLARLGYASYSSGVGVNADCPDVIMEKLIEKVEGVASRSNERLRLLGHSFGGLLARAAAAERPDLISQVISLAAPIRQVSAHPLVVAAARLLDAMTVAPSEQPRRHGDHSHRGTCFCELADVLKRPFPDGVARASVYSRGDGVVNWQACVDQAPGVNVEVRASHLGTVVNKETYQTIARLLAEPLEWIEAAA
jgi:pimeloyl-ACP methyl ester carboxylesterase